MKNTTKLEKLKKEFDEKFVETAVWGWKDKEIWSWIISTYTPKLLEEVAGEMDKLQKLHDEGVGLIDWVKELHTLREKLLADFKEGDINVK